MDNFIVSSGEIGGGLDFGFCYDGALRGLNDSCFTNSSNTFTATKSFTFRLFAKCAGYNFASETRDTMYIRAYKNGSYIINNSFYLNTTTGHVLVNIVNITVVSGDVITLTARGGNNLSAYVFSSWII